jgi:3'(2'), 5'-bisphosphate nucleotidase
MCPRVLNESLKPGFIHSDMTILISEFAASLASIAHEAGRLILKHYVAGTSARLKDDASPVTAADEEAEALILKRLAELAPEMAVVAEEEMAAGRLPQNLGTRFFLVDPLDGTKEFLKRNGEFTVNIALVEMGHPICGVVVAPAKARAFIGDGANGAFELAAPEDLPLDVTQARRIAARAAPKDGLTVIASRTHRDTKAEEYLRKYRIANLMAAGSSLKFCLVAAGEADLYPRHGRTMEWDTAAGQAVLEAAGGSVKTLDGARLLYGKIAQRFANPYFVARGAEQRD